MTTAPLPTGPQGRLWLLPLSPQDHRTGRGYCPLLVQVSEGKPTAMGYGLSYSDLGQVSCLLTLTLGKSLNLSESFFSFDKT